MSGICGGGGTLPQGLKPMSLAVRNAKAEALAYVEAEAANGLAYLEAETGSLLIWAAPLALDIS